jgi:RimJ/RimL family protein N-acetyltransferase
MQAIVELPAHNIVSYAVLFPGVHANLVILSIGAGNTPARLWQVEQPSGATLLLWDKGNNVFYLAGAQPTEPGRQALADLVDREVRPSTLAADRPYFKSRALAPHLETTLPALFRGVALREAPTLFFGPPERAAQSAPTIQGIQFAPIDRTLLTGEYANREAVISEIGSMWPSLEDFYERGFGCAALDSARLVCWCTAEYVGPDRCGVGIATDPLFERRGIATATAGRFIGMARERGIAPHWECGAWNAASIRVAEKVGFARMAEERYWIGRFDA